MNKHILNATLQKPFFIFSVFIFLILPQHAFAYLDLYTGSYLLQILLGGIFGFLFVIKIFWKKIKTFCNKIFSGKKKGGRHE